MVKIYRGVQIDADDQEFEAYDCIINGSGNIITGTGNVINGSGNTIFGKQKSIVGKDNTNVMDEKKKKRKKEEDEFSFQDTQKQIKKALEEEEVEAFGPSGIKLILDKGKDQEVDAKNRDMILCILCANNHRRVICRPCKHLCMCATCSMRLGALNTIPVCPICKKKITDFEEVYLS